MSIGTFSLVKNENSWIAAHVLRVLPFVDEMVFFDGNSTDGTLEILQAIHDDNADGGKIKISRDKDPINLEEDYTRLFNECLRSLGTDLAWFLHPDMIVDNPEQIARVKDSDSVAMSVGVRSFAGDPGGPLSEIIGRANRWKSIYRLHAPDLGVHYFGNYGAWNEDCYFSEITGGCHKFYGDDFGKYPYIVDDSGLKVLHFSDVRHYERRLSRMVKCLIHDGMSEASATEFAVRHPRVSLIPCKDMDFKPSEYPHYFLRDRDMYRHMEKEPVNV